MAKHNNPSITQRVLRIFNLKQGDSIGSEIGSMIVPTIPINPVINICRRGIVTDATNSNTIYIYVYMYIYI
jgi:hypothetical protein